MSALRRMLASLWVAVWLGWRMLGVRTRRVLGRRSRSDVPVVAEQGFYLSADSPVEGADYEIRELPADLLTGLDGMRTELVAAARETTAPRVRRHKIRRRRAASLTVAALVTLPVVGAGATALVTGSTGVPEVDRLVGIYESGSGGSGAERRPGPTGAELQPRTSPTSGSVNATLGDGSKIVSTAYVARDGDVCLGLVDGDGSGATGDVNCVSPADLRGYLRRDEGFIFGFRRYGSTVVLNGLVSDRVVTLHGRDKPVAVALGGAWAPDIDGLGKLKPFVGLAEDSGGTFLRTSEFGLEARTQGGRRTELDESP